MTWLKYDFGEVIVDDNQMFNYLKKRYLGKKNYTPKEAIKILLDNMNDDYLYILCEDENRTLEEIIEDRLKTYNNDLVKTLNSISEIDLYYEYNTKEERERVEEYFYCYARDEIFLNS